MFVNNVGSSAPSAGGGRATTQLAQNFDNFLRLLTTQMSNQDPLAPLDATEFIAQLAQFTGVEQAINTNVKLAELIALQKSGQAAVAVSYLGTTIEARGNTARLEAGKAEWSYTLAGNSVKTTIKILNDEGRTVRTLPGATTAGQHELLWDGLDDNGIPQFAGLYSIAIDARDAKDAPIPVQTNFVGRVTGVSFADGQVVLSVNGAQVALENVLSVKESLEPVAPVPESGA